MNEFLIDVNGLARGETKFLFRADKEFFANRENREVLDAALQVEVIADRNPQTVDLDCRIAGTITFPCDRCCAPVALKVDTGALLRLRTDPSSAAVEDPYEEVFLPDGASVLDLGQEVYDFSLLALPLQKFHSEGECDKAALDYLSKEEDALEAPQAVNTPFSSLAEMFDSNRKS